MECGASQLHAGSRAKEGARTPGARWGGCLAPRPPAWAEWHRGPQNGRCAPSNRSPCCKGRNMARRRNRGHTGSAPAFGRPGRRGRAPEGCGGRSASGTYLGVVVFGAGLVGGVSGRNAGRPSVERQTEGRAARFPRVYQCTSSVQITASLYILYTGEGSNWI